MRISMHNIWKGESRWFSFFVFFLTTLSTYGQQQPAMRLWYDQPAQYFEESLPIGNGRLGGLVYGGTDTCQAGTVTLLYNNQSKTLKLKAGQIMPIKIW